MDRVDRAGTLTEFAHAVREGREPETSGRDNLRTLEFTLGAIDSASRGGAEHVYVTGERQATAIR
jgi:hypothetical protein